MNVPFVSVVIPTYRRELHVVRAVRSALAQEDVVVEVIVLDDSEENSAEAGVAALSDDRVRYERCVQPTGGIPATVRNRGLALARGEFVHFLDDDDEFEAGALATLANALLEAPASGVAIGVVRPVGADPIVLEHERRYFAAAAARLRTLSTRRSICSALLFSVTPLVNSTCLVRRKVAEEIGGYAANVPRCEDVEFYLRAIRHAGHVFVDREVVRYQTGRPSLMHSLLDERLVTESYKVIHERYRRDRGPLEYLTLRLMAVWRSLPFSRVPAPVVR